MSEHHPLHAPQRPTVPSDLDGAPGRGGAPVEPTGDAAVDAALADLEAIDPDLEPAGQLPVLVAVHEALHRRLSSTEG